jgi:mono/diheme cytochrome c family protein
MMRYTLLFGLFLAIVAVAAANAASSSNPASIARGKYLVTFGACNDCHTPGWRESFGKVPVSKWLVGSNVGFRGPWGTIYPANVRQRFTEITENQWLAMVRTREGPEPMIWHDLRVLTLDDQRAIYRFVRSLGSAGPATLQDVPAQVEPKTPYITTVLPTK